MASTNREIAIPNLAELMGKFGNELMEIVDFTDVDCLIFFYLFERKIQGEPKRSAYEIYKAVNACVTSFRLFGRSRGFSQGKVSISLEKLIGYGYVKREYVNKRVMKKFKRSKKPGRPPVCLYELRSCSEIVEKIKGAIINKLDRCIKVFNSLTDIEETAAEITTRER